MYPINTKNIKYLAFLLPFLLAKDLFAQQTDLQRDNLKGKVKSISFYTDSKLKQKRTYNLRGFETGLKKYCSDDTSVTCYEGAFFFDSIGKMTKYIDDTFKVEKKYDGANNMIEEIQTDRFSKKIFNRMNYNFENLKMVKSTQTKYLYNSDKIEFSIVINYSYDSIGHLSEEDMLLTSYDHRDIKKKTFYLYDKVQNLKEKKEIDNEGRMLYNYFYKYDALNRKIEYQSRSANGSSYTNYNEYFKYDEKGNMVQSNHDELNGELLYKDVYNFDEKRNQIKKSHYYRDVLTTQIVRVFSNTGLLTSETEYKSKSLIRKTIFEYDAMGNITATLNSDANGIIKTRLDYKIDYYK